MPPMRASGWPGATGSSVVGEPLDEDPGRVRGHLDRALAGDDVADGLAGAYRGALVETVGRGGTVPAAAATTTRNSGAGSKLGAAPCRAISVAGGGQVVGVLRVTISGAVALERALDQAGERAGRRQLDDRR